MTAPQTTRPTEASLRESSRKLMRDCLGRFGQAVDEAVVERQAEKIVRSMWPTVKRAWRDVPGADPQTTVAVWCCRRTRVRGWPCPLGYVCPYD